MKALQKKFLLSSSIALLALTGHVVLAPWTAQTTAATKLSLHNWKAKRSSERFIASLQAAPPGNVSRFTSCAVAFRDHLAERHIKLLVVLRPGTTTLLSPSGGVQDKVSVGGTELLQCEKSLRKAQVNVYSLLPPLHEVLSKHPERAMIAPDGYHLEKSVCEEICALIPAALTEDRLSRSGRGLLLAGDCYAFLLGNIFREGTVLPKVRILWRNGGAHLMPNEMARMSDADLTGVKQVVWLVTDECLPTDAPFDAYPDFLPADPSQLAAVQTHRRIRATVTDDCSIPEDLGKSSPYADALLERQFRTADGEVVLGVVQGMKNRKVLPINWFPGNEVMLSLIPWDRAVKDNPAFEHEQIISSSTDYSLPRYYVAGWMHAPSQ